MSGDFLALLAREWRGSLSKSAICERVRKLAQGLKREVLTGRAEFGSRLLWTHP